MQLFITYEKYTPLERIATGEHMSLAPRYKIYAEDEDRNLFVFRSDGREVKPNDLLCVHMRTKQNRNSYSYHKTIHSAKVMAHPAPLYGENSNATSKTKADTKLIRTVVKAVTSRPVEFPTYDCDGLSLNKVTASVS